MTLGEFLKYLSANCLRESGHLHWPPDTFALCMGVLHKSGCYTLMIKSWPPEGAPNDWASYVKSIGKDWRKKALSDRTPKQVRNWWRTVAQHKNLSFDDVGKQRELVDVLLQLVAAADEACVGVGIPGVGDMDDDFELQAGTLVSEKTSLCKGIDPSKCRVLPKMHSAQNGLTVRSLTHHLAFITSDEMKPRWRYIPFETSRTELSLLLLPWPQIVAGTDFQAVSSTASMKNMRPEVGLFSYAPPRSEVTARSVRDYLSQVQRSGRRVDGLVMPELSMQNTTAHSLKSNLAEAGTFFVAGVRGKDGIDVGVNSVVVSFPFGESYVHYEQSKHHRWKLNADQVSRYRMTDLGGKSNWWENIDISNRNLNFFAMKSWLTMAVLICEDLARPDPVGDLIRAVGPNLVIALLMDGPQVEARWPGRHATVLADDPGCSVLTLSCLGMTALGADPSRGADGRRAIALWRDPTQSAGTSINLPTDGVAALLKLEVDQREEFTADGRSDHGATGYPTLKSYTFLDRGGIVLDEITIKH